MQSLNEYSELIYQIIGAAMEVHRELKWGLLEPIYQEALHLELLDRGIDNKREQGVLVFYKHHQLKKEYKMDIVVDDVVVELKSVTKLIPAHRAQLCNYLRLTRKPVGLLINFGQERLAGERWVLDVKTNRCRIVDRNMEIIPDTDYDDLLADDLGDMDDICKNE